MLKTWFLHKYFHRTHVNLLKSKGGKIYFMVDGMQQNKILTEYLAGNLPHEYETYLRTTERELIAVLMRKHTFHKTTFYFNGEPISFGVVKKVLNLPVEYE